MQACRRDITLKEVHSFLLSSFLPIDNALPSLLLALSSLCVENVILGGGRWMDQIHLYDSTKTWFFKTCVCESGPLRGTHFCKIR
jgi:hypothetical protein